MPSPFSGMDPYLEHPGLFPGLHDRMITLLGAALTTALPAPYYADLADRVWVETSQRPVTVPHDERREPYVQIFARFDDERLVTHIEILSPTNKSTGEEGRGHYLRKQREVMDSRVHLVEIDLLRGGRHTTAVPLERMLAKTGPLDYHVCIHHFHNLEDYFIYPILLEEPLPAIAIPLLPDDGDVSIDLQDVFNRAYESGPYPRRVRYGRVQVEPPLGEARRAWADGLVKERFGEEADAGRGAG